MHNSITDEKMLMPSGKISCSSSTEFSTFFNFCSYSFSMFYSPPPYHDLIFQDATRQLQIVPPESRRYDLYLGNDFMRAKRITDCQAGASAISISLTLAIICMSYIPLAQYLSL